MNARFEDLMYRAGLTAQGCWDQMDDYDRKAIEKLAELIVREVLAVQEQFIAEGHNAWHLNKPTKQHFGVKE